MARKNRAYQIIDHDVCQYFNINVATYQIFEQIHFRMGRKASDGWVYDSQRQLGEYVFLSLATCKRAFKKLQEVGLIEVEKLAPKTIRYRCVDFELHHKSARTNMGQNEPSRVQNEPSSMGQNELFGLGQNEPYKINSIKGKNKEEDKRLIAAQDCIDFFNELTGRNLKVQSKTGLVARLNDGATVELVKDVIALKFAEWRGSEMEKYLEPETLFRKSKFEKYARQVEYLKANPEKRKLWFGKRKNIPGTTSAEIQRQIARSL